MTSTAQDYLAAKADAQANAKLTVNRVWLDFSAGGKCPLSDKLQNGIAEWFAANMRGALTVADVLRFAEVAESRAQKLAGKSEWGGAVAHVEIVGAPDDSDWRSMPESQVKLAAEFHAGL